jgi:hypothetical protein
MKALIDNAADQLHAGLDFLAKGAGVGRVELLEAGEIVAQARIEGHEIGAEARFKSFLRPHAHQNKGIEDNDNGEKYDNQSQKHFRSALFYCTAGAKNRTG